MEDEEEEEEGKEGDWETAIGEVETSERGSGLGGWGRINRQQEMRTGWKDGEGI